MEWSGFGSLFPFSFFGMYILYIYMFNTMYMQAVIEQGGLAPGGLNFDCKVRRESTDLRDMFISHIGT